jgi:aminoglycoside/choline kinase family phosphotransferase
MDPLDAAAGVIGHRLTAAGTLHGSKRSRVVRATVDDGPDTVIVKSHAAGFTDHWRRESAALTVLSGRGLAVPELLGVAHDPPLVVLRDLGGGPSLADALLDDDPGVATDRLRAWVDALASLHAATTGDRPAFARILGQSTVDSMPEALAKAADGLVEVLPRLGVSPGGAALAELRAAADRLSPGAAALTPADACPDNNVVTPDGLVLLDFEQATVRHVAWDAAYLLVPWPSCWCSWALPAAVAQDALDRWRAAVTPALPMVGSAAFDRDLDIAVTAWAFVSCAWFLDGAFDEPAAAPGGGRAGPTRRGVIEHRLRQARRGPLAALATLADEVLAAISRRWGHAPLPVAPAYRTAAGAGGR